MNNSNAVRRARRAVARKRTRLAPVTVEGKVLYLKPHAVKILRAAQKLKGAF